MIDVQPFIDLGFFVVPLHGDITRLENGKKELPAFPNNWREEYTKNFYDPKSKGNAAARTGAFITGKRSSAISIDCDNKETLDMFRALDPEYNFIFHSKGKKSGGGSIIYVLTPDYENLPSFKIHNTVIELDYQTNDLLQFLPTAGNKSKIEWGMNDIADMPELKEPPKAVIVFLRHMHSIQETTKSIVNENGDLTVTAVSNHYKHLAPYIESFLSIGKFAPELFRILTPSDGGFRDLPQYKKERTLHPDNVPDGMGNDYLKSLMGVLVCDNSVSDALFKKMVKAVNKMWTKPLSTAKIDTMIRYQLTRTDKWVYDEDWHDKVSLILTNYGTLVNVFYDPIIRTYYALDTAFGMSLFTHVDQLPKHLNSIVQGGRLFKTNEMFAYLENKKTMMSPILPFGDIPAQDSKTSLGRYNLFCRSQSYDILLNPKDYTEEFADKIPHTTLAFFEHLIPDEIIRDFVIRFLLTKMLTMKFSEVVLYFLGVQGAGKNLLVDWLGEFCKNTSSSTSSESNRTVIDVDKDNFISKYNQWLTYAMFANLDEFGEKTLNTSEDARVLAQLKSYTGKSAFQLRSMNSDPVAAYHFCTFVFTANKNKLSLDLGDRRIVLIDTPYKFEDCDYVIKNGGKSKVIERLFKEQELWAYYWRTNYKLLSDDEYRTPPETPFKKALILKHLNPSKKIAALIKEQLVDAFIELVEQAEMIDDLVLDAPHGKISKDFCKKLFETLTDNPYAKTSMLDTSFKELGIDVKKMRFGGGRNVYGTEFEGLVQWHKNFLPIDDDVSEEDF